MRNFYKHFFTNLETVQVLLIHLKLSQFSYFEFLSDLNSRLEFYFLKYYPLSSQVLQEEISHSWQVRF